MVTGEQLVRLRALPAPPYEVKATRRHSQAALEHARDGRFRVFDRWAVLEPPVDWDPSGTPSFQARLQSWMFLDPLLQLAGAGDERAYRVAEALALDWLRRNPRAAEGLNRFAWADKIAADRSTYLGYLVRVAAAAGWLGDAEAEVLVGAVIDHGRWLHDDANYAADNNHGLHQDAGLATLARYTAPFLEEAAAWGSHALERFRRSLTAVVDVEEGMTLEHSVGYQVNKVVLLRTLVERGTLDDPWIRAIAARMEEVAGWLVQPDGLLSQIGDTNRSAAPAGLSRAQDGIRVLPRSGWAVARRGGSYLVTSASFFSAVHKHADELSFELSEGGVRVVADTGKYAYDPKDPQRVHARSAEAHSVLIPDGSGGAWFSRRRPYGSGLTGGGERDGWFAVRGRNPLLSDDGVEHERTLLYRPGEALIVVDRVQAARPREWKRLLQLDPAIDAVPAEPGLVALSGGGFRGEVRDHRGAEILVVRGQESPLLGWSSPAERDRVPSATLVMRSRHAGGVEALVLALSPAAVALDGVGFREDGAVEADVRIGGRDRSVAVRPDGSPAGR